MGIRRIKVTMVAEIEGRKVMEEVREYKLYCTECDIVVYRTILPPNINRENMDRFEIEHDDRFHGPSRYRILTMVMDSKKGS